MSDTRNYGNMYFMGTWSADVYYAYDDENFNYTPVVQYNGSLYAAQAPTTKGTNPATDTTGWTLILTPSGGNPITAVLTGYSASAGTVAASDTILQAFNKIGGSLATSSGQVPIGSAGGVATPRSISGAISLNNAGVTALTNASLNALGNLSNATVAGSAIRQTGLNSFANVRISNVTAGVPAASNDNTEGYVVGSTWFNTATSFLYVASDVTTGAAVWNKVLV